MLVYPLTLQVKGGFHPILLQKGENARGIECIGSIVKGEGSPFFISRSLEEKPLGKFLGEFLCFLSKGSQMLFHLGIQGEGGFCNDRTIFL